MLERIRIGTRLVLVVAIVLVVSAITGFVGVRGMYTASRAWSTIFEDDAGALMQLIAVLDGIDQRHNHVVVGIGAQSSGAAEAPFKGAEKSVEDVETVWKSYAATLTPEEQKSASEFTSAWSKYLNYSRKTIDLARSGDYEAAMEHMKGDTAQSFTDVRRALLNLVAQEEAHAKHSRESNTAANEATTLVVVGIFGFGLLLSTISAWFIIRSITRPLRQIQNCIGDVEKTSDFTRRIPLDSRDEVGSMAASFNTLMQTLQSTLHVILDNVAELSNASHALTTSSEQLAASSAKQAGAAASMAATVEEVTASVTQVSDEARQAQEISRQAGEISNRGGAIIHEAATTMTRMAETVREASGTIGELGQQSNQISAVVQVIKEVAEQTNLLALNAAIEAARAGEQGRGFAVVADEVRKLAERTTKATEEITQMIGTVQGSARLAVATMNNAVASVNSGVDLARQAGEAINQIKQGSIHVIEVVSGISSALDQQTHASGELAKHVETMTNMCEESNSSADHTANAASALEKLADTMRAAAGRFRI